jgi:predicted dehydrogenase
MPNEPFDARKHLEYRLFWPYSSGIPCQWMVHQIDTVHWFTGLPHPRSVVANGGIYLWKDGRRNWDTLTAVFDYGPLDDKSKGFEVIFSSRQTNSAGETKEIYFSNGGTMNLDTGTVTGEGGLTEQHAKVMNMKPNQLQKASLVEPTEGKTATDANMGEDAMTFAHMRNWMECVRSRKQPNAPVRAGYQHALAVIMVKAAIDTGKRVTFDDKKQEIVTS